MAYRITASCTGCTVCAKLCPVFAVTGERGALHTINERRCVSCGVCARACPKECVADASGALLAKVARANWPKPRINQAECSACQMCVDICTPRALTISLPKQRGDIAVYAQLSEPKKCVGCGLCAEICPLRIILMERGAA